MTIRFDGRSRSSDVGVVHTWLDVELHQVVTGFRTESPSGPIGCEEVLLDEIIDVDVVGRGVARVPWTLHVRGTRYPNAWANGDSGQALRIRRWHGPAVFVNLDDPFTAREAVRAAVVLTPPLTAGRT